MNYTVRGGELDLVVSKGAKVVFVEVKTRTTTEYGEPLESITPLKTRRLYRTAQIFLQEKGWEDVDAEFWAAAVYADKEQRIKKVEIFPNIFV